MRTERTLTRLDRVFARLDREPERPAHLDVPTMSRHRVVLLCATLAFYLVMVWAVVTTTWVVSFDWEVMFFRPYQQWPSVHAFLDYYVVLGQRGPTAVMVAAWLGWRSWRQHTLRPLLTLGAALLLLNATVGAAKIGMGRLGPHYATVIGSNEMWSGGDIFPSGHTANAVVTWGILAYLASTPRARRYLSAGSAALALGVGLTTVYLGTHWLSDVVLGWAAGLLVLLALPWLEPLIARTETWLFRLRDMWRDRGTKAPGAAAPAGPAPAAPATAVEDDGGPRLEPVVPLRPAASGRTAGGHHQAPPPGAHAPSRTERTPVTPRAGAGTRRPPHGDRPSRPTTSPAR
ncbi:phosphatase PAP2 family protein [Streptomyces sp. NPDC050560]|uniref:phosphatase PAP2 family protein n=1 Tax=Streptomyces sp. NPDC050560 TaxID=3365630 RepID=UPI00378FC6BD